MAESKKKAQEVETPETDVLAQVDAKIAEMLVAAEKKAQEIIAAAESKAGTKAKKAPTELDLAMEEYVTVKLFKDNDKYADDVFVAVNGEGCNIPRGEPVQVKRKFADVLEKSDMQDYKTSKFIESETEKFYEESKKFI